MYFVIARCLSSLLKQCKEKFYKGNKKRIKKEKKRDTKNIERVNKKWFIYFFSKVEKEQRKMVK